MGNFPCIIYIQSQSKFIFFNCRGGDLKHRIEEKIIKNRFFPEELILNWCFQLCSALKYLKGLRMMHRDIKPANIFLNAFDVPKVCTFHRITFISIVSFTLSAWRLWILQNIGQFTGLGKFKLWHSAIHGPGGSSISCVCRFIDKQKIMIFVDP